jgi:hypothetical protein
MIIKPSTDFLAYPDGIHGKFFKKDKSYSVTEEFGKQLIQQKQAVEATADEALKCEIENALENVPLDIREFLLGLVSQYFKDRKKEVTGTK